MPNKTYVIDGVEYALVPVEPTKAMLDAGRWEEFGEESSHLYPVDDIAVGGVWECMVKAAPSAPATVADENICRSCLGSGEATALSDSGPDAYDVTIACPSCQGTGVIPSAATVATEDGAHPLHCGFSRSEWHDKAWALYHAKALDDATLPKLSIHAIRAVFDATFDALKDAPAVAQGGGVDVEKVMALVEEYGKRREDIGVGFDEVAKASSVCDEIRALLTAAPAGMGGYCLSPVATRSLIEAADNAGRDRVTMGVMTPSVMGGYSYNGIVAVDVSDLRAAAPAATKKEKEE